MLDLSLPLLAAADAAAGHGAAPAAAAEPSVLGPIAFWMFAALTVIPSLLVVLVRDVVRAAFLLLGSLAGVAGLYGTLGADFVAFTQVLVYIGGILILLLFGVMLTNREPILLRRANPWGLVIPGALSAVAFLMALLYVVFAVDWRTHPMPAPEATSAELGDVLMKDFVLPFEIASVLLLAALVGAAVISRRKGETSLPD